MESKGFAKQMMQEYLDNYEREEEFLEFVIELCKNEPNDQSLGQKIRAEYKKLIKK
jgi:predicted GNAT family acetyltransferase